MSSKSSVGISLSVSCICLLCKEIKIEEEKGFKEILSKREKSCQNFDQLAKIYTDSQLKIIKKLRNLDSVVSITCSKCQIVLDIIFSVFKNFKEYETQLNNLKNEIMTFVEKEIDYVRLGIVNIKVEPGAEAKKETDTHDKRTLRSRNKSIEKVTKITEEPKLNVINDDDDNIPQKKRRRRRERGRRWVSKVSDKNVDKKPVSGNIIPTSQNQGQEEKPNSMLSICKNIIIKKDPNDENALKEEKKGYTKEILTEEDNKKSDLNNDNDLDTNFDQNFDDDNFQTWGSDNETDFSGEFKETEEKKSDKDFEISDKEISNDEDDDDGNSSNSEWEEPKKRAAKSKGTRKRGRPRVLNKIHRAKLYEIKKETCRYEGCDLLIAKNWRSRHEQIFHDKDEPPKLEDKKSDKEISNEDGDGNSSNIERAKSKGTRKRGRPRVYNRGDRRYRSIGRLYEIKKDKCQFEGCNMLIPRNWKSRHEQLYHGKDGPPKLTSHLLTSSGYFRKDTTLEDIYKKVRVIKRRYAQVKVGEQIKIGDKVKIRQKEYQPRSKLKVEPCKICNQPVAVNWMERHAAFHDIKCTYCEFVFKNKLDRRLHMIKVHNTIYLNPETKDLDPKPLPKTEKKASAVKNDNINSNAKVELLCHLCAKIFESKSRLKDHLRCFHNPNYYTKCEICGKLIGRKRLKIHRQVHEGKGDFICHECGCTKYTKRDLKQHIEIMHNPDRERKKCPFPDCDKTFSLNNGLRVHIRKHTGEKPFKCTDCPKSFIDTSYLKAHYKYAHKKIIKSVNKRWVKRQWKNPGSPIFLEESANNDDNDGNIFENDDANNDPGYEEIKKNEPEEADKALEQNILDAIASID